MNYGEIHVNMKQMKKFNVDSNNVRVFDTIKKNKGVVFAIDVRPYVEALTEFGIFFTVTQ